MTPAVKIETHVVARPPSRGVVNRAPTQPVEEHELLVDDQPATNSDDSESPPYANYEGIVESDSWFAPLFTNVRLMRINSPVEVRGQRRAVGGGHREGRRQRR